MQAVKKIFSHDDDKRSSSDSTAEVGNTGSLAHNNGPVAHNSHNTLGSTSDRTMLESGVGGAGSHGEGLHSQTLAKAHDGENGSLSHKHNVGEHANVPGESASHDHRHLAAVTSAFHCMSLRCDSKLTRSVPRRRGEAAPPHNRGGFARA